MCEFFTQGNLRPGSFYGFPVNVAARRCFREALRVVDKEGSRAGPEAAIRGAVACAGAAQHNVSYTGTLLYTSTVMYPAYSYV